MAKLQRRFSLGMKHFPTSEQIQKGFEAAEAQEREERRLDALPEILYSPQMQAAWKALTRDERIDVLDMLVAEGAVDDETLIALFPKIAETADIADFHPLGYGVGNMRDCPLRWAFDSETNTFTSDRYRKSLAEWSEDSRKLAEWLFR